MSKTNTYLLNALLWNLREMTNLIKLIRRKIGDVKCNSWRHPLVPCGELDVLQLLEDNKGCDRYTYLLELTFDRLLYILNLFVKYLESCDILATFKPGKNVERPQNLSMASILYMIWDRIQAHSETLFKSAKSAHSEDLTVSSFTQSDITSISSCMTCELAQNLVTQIVLKMENYFGDDPLSSSILTERKLMKDKLIASSNWSTMLTWVNAVLKDLSVIQEETQRFKIDNKRLKSRIDSGEVNLMTKVRKHEEETRALQRLCREYEDKMKGLEWELKILKQDSQKQKKESVDLESKCTELGKSLKESEMRKKSLEKLIKRERTESMKDSELKTKLELELNWRKFAQAELESLKSSLADMKTEVAEQNSRYVALEMRANQAGEKIKELNEENTRLHASLDSKQKEIEQFANKFLEAFPDISDDIGRNKYKGTGDPVIDMRHQIEANVMRINQLTAHNENLMQIISRIEAVRK